jgi:hypothetical protein
MMDCIKSQLRKHKDVLKQHENVLSVDGNQIVQLEFFLMKLED